MRANSPAQDGHARARRATGHDGSPSKEQLARLGAAPGALPVVGHLPLLVRHRLDFLKGLPAHGDLVWVHLGPWKALVVTDADLSHQLLRDDRTFDKGGYLFDRIRETGGNGLVSCAHADHRRQRRLVQPCFHRDRLPGYLRLTKEQLDIVLARWRDGHAVDVMAAMKMLTARTLLPQCLSDADLQATFADMNVVLGGVAWRALVPRSLDWIPIGPNRRYRLAQERFRRTVRRVIAEYRSAMSGPDDLLGFLLAELSADDQDPRLSELETQEQVLTLLLAGTETTATVLTWALHCIASKPELEQRLRAEAAATLPQCSLDAVGLSKLRLSRNVILETLRLFPPVPLLTRSTTRDTTLGGVRLRAGTTVAYSPYLLQHRADYFPDPAAFIPERWESTDGLLPSARGALLAFGGAPRRCIGDVLGLCQAVLMLSTIMLRWSLQAVAGASVRPATSLVLKPRTLRLVPRRPSTLGGARGERAAPPTARHGTLAATTTEVTAP